MSTEIENLDELFERTKSYLNDNKQALNELDELDAYCGDNYYELEHLKDDLEEIKKEYIEYRQACSRGGPAKNIFDQITMLLTGKAPNNNNRQQIQQQQQPQSYHQQQYPQPTQTLIDEEEKSLIIQRKYNKVNFFIS